MPLLYLLSILPILIGLFFIVRAFSRKSALNKVSNKRLVQLKKYLDQLGQLLEGVDSDELVDDPNRTLIINKFRKSAELFKRLLKTLYGKHYAHIEASDGYEKQSIMLNALAEKGILAPQEMFILMDQFIVEIQFEYPSGFDMPGAGPSFRSCVEAIPLFHEVMSAVVLRIEEYGL